jgi:hypothetical protein
VLPLLDLAVRREDIESICVSAGFSAGVPLAAILRTLGVNGEDFTFGAE